MAKRKYLIEETSVFAVVAEGEAEALTKAQPDKTGYIDPAKATRVAHQVIITEDTEEGVK